MQYNIVYVALLVCLFAYCDVLPALMNVVVAVPTAAESTQQQQPANPKSSNS
jgi:hypothetical protein